MYCTCIFSSAVFNVTVWLRYIGDESKEYLKFTHQSIIGFVQLVSSVIESFFFSFFFFNTEKLYFTVCCEALRMLKLMGNMKFYLATSSQV